MISSFIFLAILVIYLYWDFNHSRASKVLGQLKEKEPVLYSTIYGKSFLPPSTVIGGITGQGIYLKVQSEDIKKEITSIDNKSVWITLWPWAIFIGYIFINLVFRAVGSV